MRAFLALRPGVHYRREAFAAGLERLGYTVNSGPTLTPKRDDVLVIWNRYRENAQAAHAFEAKGLPVLVAENGYLGNELAGDRWYAISRNQHNGAGTWPVGDVSRWDSLNVPLGQWREGGELVILPQRGIGPPSVAMPPTWPGRVAAVLTRYGIKARVRPHPGIGEGTPLERDLANAGAVLTWGSGAALKALTWGIPVYADFPQWIGAPAALEFAGLLNGVALRSDAARLGMFRRLAWAQWRLDEIAAGTAFKALL